MRFGAAHLADGETDGTQAQRGTDEVRQRRDAVLGARGDEVGRRALQLAGILDEDDAVGGLGDLHEERVGKHGLAGRGAAGDQNVPACRDGRAHRVRLAAIHDAVDHIASEREDGDGGRGDDGQQEAF